jgi:hypothetical protein
MLSGPASGRANPELYVHGSRGKSLLREDVDECVLHPA